VACTLSYYLAYIMTMSWVSQHRLFNCTYRLCNKLYGKMRLSTHCS